MSSAKGSRSRDGCFNCRRRKRRCDEEKPVCRSCRRTTADCVYPASVATPLKFVVATSPNHYIVPLNEPGGRACFLHTTAQDLAAICPKLHDAESDDGDGDGGGEGVLRPDELRLRKQDVADIRLLRIMSPFSLSQTPESLRATESALVQYYAEVISSSRVYAQTDRNLFRTSILPRVLSEQGPLLSTVLAMSAAEWGQDLVIQGGSYRALSTQYKVRALEELQRSLCATENAEGNLLTCVLLSSLEIAEGSRPTWLRHLQGALALVDNFGESIDPSVVKFALQYFRFRYILMKTTEPKLLTDSSTTPDISEASYDHAMNRLAETESMLPFIHDSENMIDEHIGCSMEVVDIINQISALSLSAGKGTRLDARDHLYSEGQVLEHRLLDTSSQTLESHNEDYLRKSAETFRIAAQIYLRLVCYDTSIIHSSILEPQKQLLDCLSDVIVEGSPRRSFPMWPLFIAGCTCSSDEQRKVVLNLFAMVDSQWPISNISAVWKAVRTVWQTRDLAASPVPSKQHDWQEIIHKFGWKLALT